MKGGVRFMDKHLRLPDDQRIVITGMGMVTPLGVGKNDFSEKLFSGANAIDAVQAFDTSTLTSHLGAEVKGFAPRDFISVKSLRRMDKTSLMTTASARMTLEDAGITVDEDNRDRIGILLGTAFGATDITAQFADTLLGQGPSTVNPILVPNTVMNAPAGHASIELGFRGVNTTVTHFAVSAETAIAYAVSEIRRGAADVMLTGGVDIISKFYFESLTKFRGLSPDNQKMEGARPFDQERNGYVAGEGCGLICLERLDSARERGARIYCEITGVGLGSSPATPTGWPPDPRGIVRTLKRTLANADVTPANISAIVAAANGSRILDQTEGAAYSEVFASCSQKPWVTSIKGAIGESFSGGGMRACAMALSIQKACLPPTVGLNLPIAPLNFVIGRKKDMDIQNALLAGISFGGTYAYLIFQK
jgi:3-oxoacyl-[acyl-carrier-protein] synthase II